MAHQLTHTNPIPHLRNTRQIEESKVIGQEAINQNRPLCIVCKTIGRCSSLSCSNSSIYPTYEEENKLNLTTQQLVEGMMSEDDDAERNCDERMTQAREIGKKDLYDLIEQ